MRNLSLMEYLTPARAALHLSEQLGETYTETDLLQLGLDGHLKLSVNLVNNAYANRGVCIPESKASFVVKLGKYFSPACLALLADATIPRLVTREWAQSIGDEIKKFFLDGELTLHENGLLITSMGEYHNQYFEFEDQVEIIDGVYQLTMAGGEGQSVQEAIQRLNNSQAIQLTPPDMVLIKNKDGQHFQLLDYDPTRPEHDATRYFPANRLPANSDIVIQPNDLSDFIESQKTQPDTPPLPNARITAPKFRRKCMKEAILELEYDTQKMPKVARGQKGFCSKVFEHCTKKHPDDFRVSKRTLEDDWQALLDEGLIAYA